MNPEDLPCNGSDQAETMSTTAGAQDTPAAHYSDPRMCHTAAPVALNSTEG